MINSVKALKAIKKTAMPIKKSILPPHSGALSSRRQCVGVRDATVRSVVETCVHTSRTGTAPRRNAAAGDPSTSPARKTAGRTDGTRVGSCRGRRARPACERGACPVAGTTCHTPGTSVTSRPSASTDAT